MTEDEVITINQHGMFNLWVLKQNEICNGCYRGLRRYLGDSKYDGGLEVFCDGQKVNQIIINGG